MNDDIYTVVKKHAHRLGVNPSVAYVHALEFAEFVGDVENAGRLTGGNPTSSAKGLYQFIDGSVPVAIRRLSRYLMRTWMQPYVNPNDLTWEQQTLLFLGDILEKTAVVDGKRVPGLGDKLMRRVLLNGLSDQEACKEAYYILHHTNPDAATKRRVEDLINGTKDTLEETEG